MRGGIEDKTAHKESGHERGSAMRNKRQWQAGQWNNAEHCTDIDERLQNYDDGESECNKAPEKISRISSYYNAACR